MSREPAAEGSTPERATDRKWEAVLARDAGFDGAMVFAVRSTGIYCRPSCPARRPRRDNVVFFPRPEAAEGAGFRPCRRCRPRGPSPAQSRAAWVEDVCRRLAAQDEDRLRLADLGAELGLSPHHLQRTFKQLMGITPRQYADAVRLGFFRALLRKGSHVTEALYDAGYGSSSRAYEGAASRLGMTPGTYRKGGRGMRIAYTVAASPLAACWWPPPTEAFRRYASATRTRRWRRPCAPSIPRLRCAVTTPA